MTITTITPPRLFTFAGGTSGQWRVERVLPVTGATLDATSHVAVVAGPFLQPTASASWLLRGITSNERYVIREEKARYRLGKLIFKETQELAQTSVKAKH